MILKYHREISPLRIDLKAEAQKILRGRKYGESNKRTNWRPEEAVLTAQKSTNGGHIWGDT